MADNGFIRWWEDRNSRVKLNYKLKDILISKRKEKKLTQKDIALKLKIREASISHWESGWRNPPVKVLIKWLNHLGISLSEVEKEVILFRAPNDEYTISNFPIKEKPEHVEIISHIFFDGTFGRGKSFIYESPNVDEQKMFKKMISRAGFESSLYKTKVNKKVFHGLSSVASNILLIHYKITNNFFSEKIINYARKMKDWRNAILRACFIDEGSVGKKIVRDNLFIASSLKNKKLVEQIIELANIDYSCRLCKNYERSEFTVLLHNRSLPDFYINNLIAVPNEYYKKINIEKMIKRLEPSKFKW
jgi:transcriptional regulator with XRE-family HTH domain